MEIDGYVFLRPFSLSVSPVSFFFPFSSSRFLAIFLFSSRGSIRFFDTDARENGGGGGGGGGGGDCEKNALIATGQENTIRTDDTLLNFISLRRCSIALPSLATLSSPSSSFSSSFFFAFFLRLHVFTPVASSTSRNETQSGSLRLNISSSETGDLFYSLKDDWHRAEVSINFFSFFSSASAPSRRVLFNSTFARFSSSVFKRRSLVPERFTLKEDSTFFGNFETKY